MNVNAMLRLDMLVEGDAFSDLDSLSERLVQLTSVAAFDASKFTADVDRDADLVARVRESYRTEVELGMQRCIKVPINIKLTVQEDTKVMVISADEEAQAVRRPRRYDPEVQRRIGKGRRRGVHPDLRPEGQRRR